MDEIFIRYKYKERSCIISENAYDAPKYTCLRNTYFFRCINKLSVEEINTEHNNYKIFKSCTDTVKIGYATTIFYKKKRNERIKKKQDIKKSRF
ncbi:hypothetical protein GCM10027516_21390 [Niabella aquatica]